MLNCSIKNCPDGYGNPHCFKSVLFISELYRFLTAVITLIIIPDLRIKKEKIL
jgi:hypothetical protein